MKVLHININYVGTPLHKNMVTALEKMGVKNTVFAPTCKNVGEVVAESYQVIVSRCYRYWDGLSFLYKQGKIFDAIEQAVAIEDFDLIHAHTVSSDGNVAYRLHRKYGLKYIVAVRNTDLNSFFKKRKHLRWLGIKILRNAEKVCFLSSAYQKALLERYVPKKIRKEILGKSVILPNGIDPFWLIHMQENASGEEKKNRLKQKRLRLVFAGRIEKNKNCRLTVDACKILHERGWAIEYHVAGKIVDQEEYTYLKSLEGFVYHGVLDKNQMIALYRECDLYVMPSHEETFGLTYAEAMTQGLPVIYTKGQGFDGQFPDGEIGYPVSDRDATELADSIEECVAQYDVICKNLRSNSIRFDWEKIAPQYVRIYEDIVK